MNADIVELPVNEIRVEKPFIHFFPINEDTVRAIRIDMATNGFDPGFPLIVWKDRQILVDGHTRFMAAKGISLEQVPVILKHFESEDDAVLYAFHLQRNRRNLSDDDIIRCLEVLDKIHSKRTVKKEGTPAPTKKEIVEERARELGTSKSKIEKAQKILEHGDDDIKEKVQSGKASINKAYNELQAQKKDSGELSGKATTGLASDARYVKAYNKLADEIRFLRDEGWVQITRNRIVEDLEQLIRSLD